MPLSFGGLFEVCDNVAVPKALDQKVSNSSGSYSKDFSSAII